MTVLYVDWWMYDEEAEAIKVHAVVEDTLVEPASRNEPEVYRPGLCEAIIMTEQADWPHREVDQLKWLEEIDPEWTLINKGEW